MRLDDATDFSNIRVQCLGKEYHATAAAWQCLEEVRELRNERTNKKNPYDERISFDEVERRYVHHASENSIVHKMLANFGLTNDDETPQQRLARFEGDLRKQKSPDSIGNVLTFVYHKFGF